MSHLKGVYLFIFAFLFPLGITEHDIVFLVKREG